MRLKLYFLLALLPLWHSRRANAAVTVGATRLIYNGASNEANLSVSNRDDTSPYLGAVLGQPFRRRQRGKRR